jgi:hypothetical protein
VFFLAKSAEWIEKKRLEFGKKDQKSAQESEKKWDTRKWTVTRGP